MLYQQDIITLTETVPATGETSITKETPQSNQAPYSPSSSVKKKLSKRPRRSFVQFADIKNATVMIENVSVEDFPDLWYTAEDMNNFQLNAQRRAANLVKLDKVSSSLTWTKAVLVDYQILRRVNKTEQVNTAALVLDASFVDENTVGLEAGIEAIGNDLAVRRDYLYQQICNIQFNKSLRASKKAHLIRETSRVCSRTARLLAQHMALAAVAYA